LFAKIFYALIIILLPLSAATSHAQETSPEKRELIKELLVVMDAKKNAVSIMDSTAEQFQKAALSTLEQAVERDTSLTAAQRAEKLRATVEASQRSADRFRELFNQRANYSQVIEEVSYELYDKHFTVEDLRHLIAFHKTATGQKLISIMPRLFSESMAKTSERLTPIMQAIAQEIMEEELIRAAAASPVKKAPRRRRR
jgi:hypothetical protein